MEQPILTVVETFVRELHHIKAHKDGCSLTISLTVGLHNRYDNSDKPKIQLRADFFDGTNHQNVTAASLDALITEVRRRLGFEDRESIELQRLEHRFVALSKPTACE